jgi:hypothetical protein
MQENALISEIFSHKVSQSISVVKPSDKETKKTKSVLPDNSKSETKAKEMNHMLSKATITAYYHNALIVSCIAYDRMFRTRKCLRLGCRKEGLTKEVS